MDRLKKYIEITEMVQLPGRATKRWLVSLKGLESLGEIKWYGGWRKYVYFNYAAESYFDWDFLRMVADFCEAKTSEHYGK